MSLTITLLACATCYGAPGSPMTEGMNAAIFTMLGVTGLVLSGCAALMITFVKRARRHAAFEAELDELLKDTTP